MIEVKDLTMMNIIDGHLDIALQIYQFNGWTMIVTHMRDNDWSGIFG